jgi:hypothetical protein
MPKTSARGRIGVAVARDLCVDVGFTNGGDVGNGMSVGLLVGMVVSVGVGGVVVSVGEAPIWMLINWQAILAIKGRISNDLRIPCSPISHHFILLFLIRSLPSSYFASDPLIVNNFVNFS